MDKKILILQNQITPYRSIVFDELAKQLGDKLLVLYCNKVESNRQWQIDKLKHKHAFLNKTFLKFGNRYIYFNFDIFRMINKYSPDIIVTYGFNPVMLFAWLYSIIKRKKHFVLTDSWLLIVNKLTIIHRLVRKLVFRFTDAFLCVGRKGKEYLKTYKVDEHKIFLSQLVTDNDYYRNFITQNKEYDIVFSGRFIDIKMPFFVIDIVRELKKFHPKIRFLLIGNGELTDKMLSKLKEFEIDYNYPGFIQQDKLPKYYSTSKLLLFPSEQDPWGLVANEACASGVPVITCDNTGVADDLIINGYNGYVLPLNVQTWVKTIETIFQDEQLYFRLSENALKSVDRFTVDVAAKGFIDAINYVYKENI